MASPGGTWDLLVLGRVLYHLALSPPLIPLWDLFLQRIIISLNFIGLLKIDMQLITANLQGVDAVSKGIRYHHTVMVVFLSLGIPSDRSLRVVHAIVWGGWDLFIF